MKRQSTIAAVSAAVMLLVLLPVSGCGSRHHSASIAPPAGTGVQPGDAHAQTPEAGLWVAALKDAAGAPIGVRVTWTRSGDVTVQGYYIYRDSQPLGERDPAKRVNQGEIIPQGPPDQPTMSFDDYFKPVVDSTYYYRITAVDFDGDESTFSAQRTITIGRFNMTGFTPQQGPVDCEVRIDGEHFGLYDMRTDHVYFTGLVDDKTPSTLQPGLVEAYIDAPKWTNRAIRVNVPPGTTTGPITLVVGGLTQVSLDDFVCTSPFITNVTPDPAKSRDTLEIDGENLGSHQLENRLLLNGVPYQTITSWNNTHVRATVPSGIEPGLYEVQLRVKVVTRLEDTNGAWIDIIGLPPAPQIDKVSPLFGEPGYTEVTVSGSNFGSDASIAELRFNGLSLTEGGFTSYGDTEIHFTFPDGVTRSGEVQLILHAAEDVPGNLYRYTANIPGGVVAPNGVAAGFDMGRYSAVEYDSSGNLHVLFTDNTPNNAHRMLFMAHQQSGTTFDYEALDPLDGAEDFYVAMAIDSSDNIHIAYQRQPDPFGSPDKEVRYGYFDGTDWSFETVYAPTSEVAGDYVDITLYSDPFSGVERYIAWRNPTTEDIELAYMLPGETSWTVLTAFSPLSSTKEIGHHLAIEVFATTVPPPAPPKQPSALGTSGELGFSWERRDTANAESQVEYGYTQNLSDFYTIAVDGPYTEIKETDIEFDDPAETPTVMWVTDNTVYSAPYNGGFSTETVFSDTGSAGAGSRMKMNASYLPRIFGHRSGNQFYYAYRSAAGGWTVVNVPVGNSHAVDASGRWDMAYDVSTDYLALSFCDGTYRDAHLMVREGTSNSNITLGDGFAEPGASLTNQSIIIGSDGRPRITFFDEDSTTGDKTLFFGKFVGGTGSPPPGPPFDESSQWEFITIDNTDLDMLGHPVMDVDGEDRYNILYLRDFEWTDPEGTHLQRRVYFTEADIGGFTTPKAVTVVGGNDAFPPQIALGPSNDTVYCLEYMTEDSNLVLYRSDDGFETLDNVWIVASEGSISEFDVAAHRNEKSAVVAYYSPGSNAIILKDYADESTVLLPGTAGFDTGISLTLDADEHASIICADVSGTGALKWIHWDDGGGGGGGAYVVEDIASDASTSLTTSQSGTIWGPAASYYNTATGEHSLFVSFLDSFGQWNQLKAVELYGGSQQLRHSLDAYTNSWFVTALYGADDFANNLVVLDVRPIN